MELRIKRSRVMIGLAGVALAFAIVGIAVAPHSTSGEVAPNPAPGTCADLARDVDPSRSPVDSGYDPERDVVYAHHGGRTYVMRPNDPLCRALTRARAVIDDAMATARENTDAACKAMRDIVSSGRSEHRGRSVDRAAAERFISRRCAAGRP